MPERRGSYLAYLLRYWRGLPLPECRVEPELPAELAASAAPLIATVDVPACPVCGGRESQPFAAGYDYELLTCRNAWRFARCPCGHVRLNPRPATETLPVMPVPICCCNRKSSKSRLVTPGIKSCFARRLPVERRDGLS